MMLAVAFTLLILLGCGGAGGYLATALRCTECPELPVLRVIDEDTLDSDLARIRLFGIDAPESGQSCYSEALNRLRDLAGDTVRVESGPRLSDQYGRTLAYVYTGDGMSVDEILIREGLARAWTGDGQHRNHLLEMEREARRNYTGCLW